MAPKMDPGGLLKRVRKTVGNSSAQKGLLDASGAVKKKRKPYLKVVGGDSCFPKGGRVRGGKGRVAEIGHPGSLGRPIYQRNRVKQPITTGSDTPLGRWPGEFFALFIFFKKSFCILHDSISSIHLQ